MRTSVQIVLLFALLLAAGTALGQPYENSSVVGQVPDRIMITVRADVKMALDKSAGTPRVGVPALDALSERFAVRDMGALYEGMTGNLDKAARGELDRVWTVDFPAEKGLAAVEKAYAALPEVEKVQRVDICRMYDAYLPNDPSLNAQWYLRNTSLGGGDVRAVGAWSETLGDSNVVVCILDSGLDWHHPDLGGPHPDKVNGAVWTNWAEYYGTPNVDDDGNGKKDDIRGWDFVNTSPSEGWPDEDVTTADNDPMDYGSHGTQCAGTVAAISNNGIGITGVAPGCKVMAVRVGYTPNGTSQGIVRMDWVAAGMIYAANNGADIINCSWGSSSSLSLAVSAAQGAGCLLITAAGNDDTDNDPGIGVPSYLSTYPGVIAVAATESSDGKASFSNYGSWVEISAPGTAIYTTTYSPSTDTHTYSSVQGTSFSSPITAGAAALIWSAQPGLSASGVANLLYASADDIDAVNPLYAGDLGAGRVNVLAALGDGFHRYPQEFPTIFDALNSAAAGDTVAVTADAVLSGTQTVRQGIRLVGGYAADYLSRDPVGTPTRINALPNNAGLRFDGAVDTNTVVDGFLVSGGGGVVSAGLPYTAAYGGGVFINGGSPTLRNLLLTGNSVGSSSQLGCGGGIYLANSSAVLENVHIQGNTGILGSGAFFYQSAPTLVDCLIEDNPAITDNLSYAPAGGGIHALDSDLVLVDTTVRDHLDRVSGGGIYVAGHNASSSLDMSGGVISGNTAKDFGGGLYHSGGALTLHRVEITGNGKTAASTFMHGGGVYATGAAATADSLSCLSNDANVGAGIELNGNTSAVVTNGLFADNVASLWGGGITWDGNAAGEIRGNTVTGNNAVVGGSGLFVANGSPAVENNISALNLGGASYANGMMFLTAPASLACNDVFGNDNTQYQGVADPTGTDGNIAVDPMFCGVPVGLPGNVEKDAFDTAYGYGFGIASDSPCAAANTGGCGLIGAFTAGCGGSPVPGEEPNLPVVFRVDQNFPNPFNPRTTIRFALPEAGPTRVEIFDVAGRHVRTVLDEDLGAAVHEVAWTGDDDRGRKVSAGVYFYMVRSGAHRSVGRMALVK